MSHNTVLNNIDYARCLCRTNRSIGQIVLVCGGADDQAYLQDLFCEHSSDMFNADGSTRIFVFEERIGSKTRQGNFLGTLLAYRALKDQDAGLCAHRADDVVLMGMVFGRGERISPFSQAVGNRKALISVMSPRLHEWDAKPLTSIEEAMCFFAPLAAALQTGGFRGVLCKWGDETQIPSVCLKDLAVDGRFASGDVIKCVAQIPMTDETANHKDWVIFDASDARMIAQCPRNDKKNLEHIINDWKSKYPSARPAVSLGPVAVSHKILDLAYDIFLDDIRRDGTFLDFDPYLIQALCSDGDEATLERESGKDQGFCAVIRMIPDFWAKIKNLKQRFADCYGRPLRVDILDLGEDLYWADIGQHAAFAEKVFSINEKSPRGEIARKIEDIVEIPGIRDARGNLVLDSFVAPGIDVFDSVIIHSVITGTGSVAGSVIKNSLLHDVKIKKGFVLHSARASVVMGENSGLYEALGLRPVALAVNERMGTLLTGGEPVDLRVSAVTDLKDKAVNYEKPILDNGLSFAQAFDIMRPFSFPVLRQFRRLAVSEVTELVVGHLFEMLKSGLVSEDDVNRALAVIALKKVEK